MGPEALLTAVHKVLNLHIRFRQVFDEADSHLAQIIKDYEDARAQARWNFRISMLVALAGIVIIFIGVCLAMANALAVGMINVFGGIIAEAVSVLFFRRADGANKRMDEYHREHMKYLESKKSLKDILAACEELLSIERRESCKEKVVEIAMELWLHHMQSGSPK